LKAAPVRRRRAATGRLWTDAGQPRRPKARARRIPDLLAQQCVS